MEDNLVLIDIDRVRDRKEPIPKIGSFFLRGTNSSYRLFPVTSYFTRMRPRNKDQPLTRRVISLFEAAKEDKMGAE